MVRDNINEKAKKEENAKTLEKEKQEKVRKIMEEEEIVKKALEIIKNQDTSMDEIICCEYRRTFSTFGKRTDASVTSMGCTVKDSWVTLDDSIDTYRMILTRREYLLAKLIGMLGDIDKLKKSYILVSSEESPKSWHETATPLGGWWNRADIKAQRGSHLANTLEIVEIEDTPKIEEIKAMKKYKLDAVHTLPKETLSKTAHFKLLGRDIEISNEEALLSSLDVNSDSFEITEEEPIKSNTVNLESRNDSEISEKEPPKTDTLQLKPSYSLDSLKKAIANFFSKQR